jgi:uncharacterized protein
VPRNIHALAEKEMEVFLGISREWYELFGRMAPFLLFGYFFAGLLHVFIRPEKISSHLGENNFSSVFKAAVFGAPLPLCSCGVIPSALALRKEGASRGAVLSFLISTPTTGVDSILATYSLLGPFFTVYRAAASVVTGIFSGTLANLFLRHDSFDKTRPEGSCVKCAGGDMQKRPGEGNKIIKIFRYAYVDLLKDSGPALLLGTVLAGVISYFMPKDLLESQLGYGLMPMLVMLFIGLPMYVCATSSIPIAASLMVKGLSPGAAFVFLLAGSATNIVTMSVVEKSMGKKTLVIYLFSIALSAILMGGALNFFWGYSARQNILGHIHHSGEIIPGWATILSSALLFGLIAGGIFSRAVKKIKTNNSEGGE